MGQQKKNLKFNGAAITFIELKEEPDKSVIKNLINMKDEDIADKVESSEKTVDDKKSKKRRARILSSYDEENDTLLKKEHAVSPSDLLI